MQCKPRLFDYGRLWFNILRNPKKWLNSILCELSPWIDGIIHLSFIHIVCYGWSSNSPFWWSPEILLLLDLDAAFLYLGVIEYSHFCRTETWGDKILEAAVGWQTRPDCEGDWSAFVIQNKAGKSSGGLQRTTFHCSGVSLKSVRGLFIFGLERLLQFLLAGGRWDKLVWIKKNSVMSSWLVSWEKRSWVTHSSWQEKVLWEITGDVQIFSLEKRVVIFKFLKGCHAQ